MCLSFEYETFLHVSHGKQYDKQVQGGSVHIIEPDTLCVYQIPKALCVVLKEGKIKRINNLPLTLGEQLSYNLCSAPL